MEEQVCCPPFDPKPWEKRFVSFDDQYFMKVKVRTFNHIPLNFGSVMTKAQKQIEASGAKVVNNIALSNHVSRWTMEVYIAIDKEVAELKPIRFGKSFQCTRGPFKDTAICARILNGWPRRRSSINTWYMGTPPVLRVQEVWEEYVVVLAR